MFSIIIIFLIIVSIIFLQVILFKHHETTSSSCTEPFLNEDALGYDDSSKIPNLIWTYWHSDELDPLVQKCINTWRTHNPSYQINVITQSNVDKYLPNHNIDPQLTHQWFSDNVRLQALSKYGGFWLDASIILNKSLGWVHRLQNKYGYELIGFYIGGQEHYQVIENWFFACTPQSKILTMWKNELDDLNNSPSVGAYIARNQIDVSKIDNRLINYLTSHVAAQTVFQKHMTKTELDAKIKLFSATNGPFRFLNDQKWDIPKAIHHLCQEQEYDKDPIIKMRSAERNELHNMGFVSPTYDGCSRIQSLK